MFYILDENRETVKVDANQYQIWCENNSHHVKFHKMPEGVTVSTVFLGVNHNYRDDDKPLLFETMVFGGEYDRLQVMYRTWNQAEEGHQNAVNLVMASLKTEQKN